MSSLEIHILHNLKEVFRGHERKDAVNIRMKELVQVPHSCISLCSWEQFPAFFCLSFSHRRNKNIAILTHSHSPTKKYLCFRCQSTTVVGRATNMTHLVTEKYPLRSSYYTTAYFITKKYSKNKTTEHVYKVTWLQTELEKWRVFSAPFHRRFFITFLLSTQ